MEKNTAGKWVVFAFGDEGHANPGEPITGDAANITANVRIDGGAANAVDDTNPTELEGGYYVFDITAAEANGDNILICPQSATANVNVIGVPGAVWTRPANFNDLSITATTGRMVVDTNNDKAGYSLSSTGLDAITQAATGMIEIAKAVWDRVISKANHDIGQSAGKILRQSGDLVQIDGAVSDATPSKTNFDTNLTQADTYFDDAVMIFTNGSANAGIGKPIKAYLNANGNCTFDLPDDWPVTPVNGDDFVIYAHHVHPVSQITADIDANSAQLAAIVEDTGTTIPNQIAALNDPTAAAIAAAVASYDMGNGRTIEESLAFLRNRWTLSGGMLTVYGTDDTTVLWTSAVTQTAGDPVSASDPA